MELNKKLSQIQAKLKAKKSKFNSFGKYNYRSAEDILEALKPYLIEHNVTVIINESIEEQAGLLIMNSVATISDGNTEIQAVALVAVDMEQRGMNAPQKFGSASSYGKKYALGNLFLIDDTADSDATNKHGKESKPKLEGAALTKAKAFIKSGGSVDAIKAKYDIPADVLKTL
tara:strand:+ start:1669 stop:2187 length:519 start_codon:yes stop_codon:yes gene_type:complete